MDSTAFDRDTVLTEFLTDYLDDNLDSAERASFEEYLAQNEREKVFAQKAMQGKKVLARFSDKIDLALITA